MQAKKTSGGNTAFIRQEKEISNMSKAPPKLENTVLPKDVINKHAGHWEAHLKSIAHFLIPQKLSETEQNDTGEPVAKNPKLSEDLLPLRKTAKTLSKILGTTKDVMLNEKFLKNATKNSSSRYYKEHFLNHLAHIQEQVLKQHKEINEAIVECSTNFKKVSHEIP